ncbi:MAG: phosphatase PAP2 family protein [Prevotella sp.]|nr:phosphatase PAP2 family protein [Prevotella sp.]
MEKKLVAASRILSMVFNPLYLPVVGMIVLFFFSYLNMLPWTYKLTVLALVALFTLLLPTLLIRWYTNYHGRKLFSLGQKERRAVPYIISILCYFSCCFIMAYFHIPHFISTILVAALAVQVVCAFVNAWWKVSTHSAAIGAVTGAIVVFSVVFGFYLLWWLCLALIVSGLVCSSRLVLRVHTLSQVVGGYFIGFALAVLVVLYI